MPRFKDLTGQRFGRLTVICRVKLRNKGRGTFYLCLCDCGYHTIVNAISLTGGDTKSCGCLNRDSTRNINRNASATGYRGVTFLKRSGKYRAQIVHQKKEYYLGQFDTPQEAHEAYEKARAELKAASHIGGGTGVTYSETRKKWHAQICVSGTRYNLGRYNTEAEARNARASAEEALRRGVFNEFWEGKQNAKK